MRARSQRSHDFDTLRFLRLRALFSSYEDTIPDYKSTHIRGLLKQARIHYHSGYIYFIGGR